MLWAPLAVTVTLPQLCTSWRGADLGPGRGCGCLGACVAERNSTLPWHKADRPFSGICPALRDIESAQPSHLPAIPTPILEHVSLVLFLNVCPHRFGSRPRLPAWLLSELPIAAGLVSEAAPSCRHKETFGMCTTKTPERDLTASRAGSLLLGARVLLRVCRQNRKERCRGPLEGASVPYALIFVSFF